MGYFHTAYFKSGGRNIFAGVLFQFRACVCVCVCGVEREKPDEAVRR